ncbi:MAG: hypothetical protein L0271_24640, partial [Gemmatimonadetes bacterium]|nr:hypothetical protein [Gemmatimonadota bacterium]
RPLRPDSQLLDSSRPERVGRTDERSLAQRSREIRELSDRRGLAGSVDSHDQDNAGGVTVGRNRTRRREDCEDLVLDEISQTVTPSRLIGNGLDNPRGGLHADIRRQQQLLKILEGRDIERPVPLVWRICPPDNRIEALDELLRGPRESLANPAEHSHGAILAFVQDSAR